VRQPPERMATEPSQNKVGAIYQLREAVEAKAQAEHALEHDASAGARDVPLAAQPDVEAKTQEAIDVCHECGHARADGHSHPPGPLVGERAGNVVHVKFRPVSEAN
jgi:hypothetical protein